jgi:DNA polymerase-3 subunit beta
MATTVASARNELRVDRRRLLEALQRVGRVIPNGAYRPILHGVRLEASDGALQIRATDLDVSLTAEVRAQGHLAACLVSAPELTRRLKAAKADTCSMQFQPKRQSLILNGGRVDHTLHTMDLAEFPHVADKPQGKAITLDGQQFKHGLVTALVGAANEPTRYAIQGVLLESDDDGVRLAATDGRRLVVVELEHADQEFKGQAILPARLVALVPKFIDRKSRDYVRVFVKEHPADDGNPQSSDLFVAGRDWLVQATEVDGRFPRHPDVVPATASKFVVDREAFIETLTEVSTSTSVEAKGVQVELAPDFIKLTARAPEQGESTGKVDAVFAGGGDDRIVTGFNPPFLLDAFRTLSGDRAVIDIGQNMLDRTNNTVRGRPASVCSLDCSRVRWVIMPINTGWAASRETLGSNYEDKESPEAQDPPSEDAAKTGTATSARMPRRRRKVDHAWPDVGSRLEGEYQGQSYAAVVIQAAGSKSGRAVQVITGPAAGQTCRSMTAAMEAATAEQRRQLGLGKSKKGLPPSGWGFWKEAQAEPMTA